jgi:hypothetical protein
MRLAGCEAWKHSKGIMAVFGRIPSHPLIFLPSQPLTLFLLSSDF